MVDWSRDQLLLPTRRIEGPRPVTTRVRPTRIAYLVDLTSIPIALAAIGGACLEWGGRYNFLIPCAAGGCPPQPWDIVLEKFDPDLILDLVGASDEFTQQEMSQHGTVTVRCPDPLQRWR